MPRLILLLLLALLPAAPAPADPNSDAPTYDAAGQLLLPAHYREWVFLTSGVDMSYDLKPQPAGHTMFNNVFVNPAAYRAFLATGTWPDKTVLVLENRGGEAARSINTRGRTQSPEVMGIEIHVKDAAGPQHTLPGNWGFFAFGGKPAAKLIPRPADCYTCHDDHAAVATTFVQFYPTLLPLAEQKHTLSPAYLKELPTPPAK